jgi:signal transduction histidine kinase
MSLSLRTRILFTQAPLLFLLAVLGGAGAVLLYRLGERIDVILRENYASVVAMERLNEALERIDSSFQFALAGEEDKARRQYEPNWESYREHLQVEQGNITLAEEPALVQWLSNLTVDYRNKGDAFFTRKPGDPGQQQAYFGPGGLLNTFRQIKEVSGRIRLLNQENMEEANRDARRTARESLFWFGSGLAMAVVLAGVLTWHTIGTILRPIQAVTQSAQAIGAGNLDQLVPVLAHDELGHLADTFNTMARQLRNYRRSTYERLLRAQRTSQATIDSFPVPVLVVDPAGAVEMANPAAQHLLGVRALREGETVARPWLPPEPLRRPLAAALREQRPFLPEGFEEAVVLQADGGERSFLPRILPIGDAYGNTVGAAVLLMDVTNFRLLDQVKSNLVATVSHELKTPLTSIRLVVHLLLEETVGILNPKQTELLLDARDNTERLLAMINNLLNLARLEEGREHLQVGPEAPGTLLQAAADAIRPRAADKGLSVVVVCPEDLPLIAVDAQRLGHALANLLDNALTYTEHGGRISLSAAAADGRVILEVADTGQGIASQYLPFVFERFFRVPGQSQGSGTGLGLALVREIVVAHRGTITCDSRPGAGTLFRISLPTWEGCQDG